MTPVEELRGAVALLRDAVIGDLPPGPWRMHPDVGLALADMLEELATGLTQMEGIFDEAVLTAAGSSGGRLARLILAGGGS